jgi:hypothetical protein
MYTPTRKLLPREFNICPRPYTPVWTWYRYLSPYLESYVVCKPHRLICPQKGYDTRKYHCRKNWNISKWPYASRGLYPLHPHWHLTLYGNEKDSCFTFPVKAALHEQPHTHYFGLLMNSIIGQIRFLYNTSSTFWNNFEGTPFTKIQRWHLCGSMLCAIRALRTKN